MYRKTSNYLINLFSQIKSALPTSFWDWMLIAISVFIIGSIYYIRSWTNYINGLTLLIELPLICLLTILIPIIIIVAIIYYRKGKIIIPAIILIFGTVITFYLPFAPSPEERLFLYNRARYEHLVDMARSGKLPISQECDGDGRFAYPEGYLDLAMRKNDWKCINVESIPAFIVEFAPNDWYYQIVYMDDTNKFKETQGVCNSDGDGTIIKKIDDNWFLCRVDWN